MKKSVLITGASSGIGEATAFKFSEQGYHCVLHGRDQTRLGTLSSKLPSSEILTLDLSKSDNVANELKTLLSKQDLSIECLVNNAGTFETGEFTSTPISSWKHTFEVNLFSLVAVTQEVAKYFRTRGIKGNIINVSSTLSYKGSPGTTAYSASKAALNNLTLALANELGTLGIRVNAVSPGLVDTPIHSFHGLEKEAKNKVLEKMGSLQPLGRIGTPGEIAEAIYFLASPASAWTTGTIINVDGGINIK
ncbi:MAG: SDR family oxidoreductase [Bdellovibrionota bacterium]